MPVNSTAVRTAIVSLLEAAGAENVYTEDPMLQDWDRTVDFLREQGGQYIQCWVIRRTASDPLTSESGYTRVAIGCDIIWRHTFSVLLFFGYLENNSEDVMQSLIDSILTYFQIQRTLGDVVFGVEKPLALVSMRPSELGGIAGWESTFTITAQVVESGLTPV